MLFPSFQISLHWQWLLGHRLNGHHRSDPIFYSESFSMTINFNRRLSLSVLSAVVVLGTYGCAAMNEPAQAVMLLQPADGATVSSPFKVRFGIKGMTVAEAGDILPNSGHHHLLINQAPIAKGESVPFSEQHLHFGKGQTETEVKLAPGVYRLTAQFANGAHQSYGAPMSRTITVTVK